jgi:hypothetical protein
MSREKVLALIQAGILTSLRNIEDGRPQLLVPASELDSFCAEFVSTESLAHRLGMSTKSLVDCLRERNTDFFSVPMAYGKAPGLFVPVSAAQALAASRLHQEKSCVLNSTRRENAA